MPTAMLVDISKSLRRKTAIVVFDFAPTGGRALLVTAADGVEVVPLPALSVVKSVADRIARFLDERSVVLENNGSGSGIESAATTSDSLPEVMSDTGMLVSSRIQQRLESCRRLIIVPDEPLFDLPWLAVPFGSGTLLDWFWDGISLAPSVSVIHRNSTRRPSVLPGKPFHEAESTESLLYPIAHWSRMIIPGEAHFDRLSPGKSFFQTRDGNVTAAELDIRSEISNRQGVAGTAGVGPWSHLECVVSLNGVSARTSPIKGGERSGLMWSALARGTRSCIGTMWPVGTNVQRSFLAAFYEAARTQPLAAALIQATRIIRSGYANGSPREHNWAALTHYGSL